MIRERALWGFAGFCLLSGSGWVLRQVWPSKIEWPFASCIHYALIACAAFVVVALRTRWKGCTVRRLVALAGVGVCLLVVPSIALNVAAGEVSEFAIATIFCAAPLMTVLVAGLWGADVGDATRARGLMVPALVGLGGALLLFPMSNPGSLHGWVMLAMVAAACAVIAAASVLIHPLLQGVGVAEAVAMIALACAAALAVWATLRGWPPMGARQAAGEVLRGAVFDLPEIWLLVWLMREVPPARLSARFLLAPLVTVLERYTAARVGLDWRQIVAAALICAGAAMLLFRDEPEEIPGLRLE